MPPSDMVEQLIDSVLMPVIIAAVAEIAEQGAAAGRYDHLPESERQLYRDALTHAMHGRAVRALLWAIYDEYNETHDFDMLVC